MTSGERRHAGTMAPEPWQVLGNRSGAAHAGQWMHRPQQGQVMKTFEPVALLLRRSTRERSRTSASYHGRRVAWRHSSQSRWKVLVRLQTVAACFGEVNNLFAVSDTTANQPFDCGAHPRRYRSNDHRLPVKPHIQFRRIRRGPVHVRAADRKGEDCLHQGLGKVVFHQVSSSLTGR